MDTMGARISALIKHFGLTKTDFAAKINLSQSHISKITLGDTVPSDRTILDICRVFDVSESWLRTGQGDMLVPRTREQEITEFMADLLKGEPDFRRRFISVLSRLDDDQWKLLEAKIRELAEEP